MKWRLELACLVGLVGWAAQGQQVAANLPDMPEPKVETVSPTVSIPGRRDIHRFDKRVFWGMTGALAASQIADTLTTESVINHGGHEQNHIFGQHPKPVPYAITNLGIFAAQVGIFYLTETLEASCDPLGWASFHRRRDGQSRSACSVQREHQPARPNPEVFKLYGSVLGRCRQP